jgi:hypothetical protein
MNEVVTVERTIHINRRKRGRRELTDGPGPVALPPGRVPRVARLLALAHRMEGLLREGVVEDYVQLAALGRVTRARITQIMNLLCLAPDIQEELLFLPKTLQGRDPLVLRDLQPITRVLGWGEQREWWQRLWMQRGRASPPPTC